MQTATMTPMIMSPGYPGPERACCRRQPGARAHGTPHAPLELRDELLGVGYAEHDRLELLSGEGQADRSLAAMDRHEGFLSLVAECAVGAHERNRGAGRSDAADRTERVIDHFSALQGVAGNDDVSRGQPSAARRTTGGR